MPKKQEFPGGPVVRTRAFTAVAQVQSLLGELRSHKLLGASKKNQKTVLCTGLFVY